MDIVGPVKSGRIPEFRVMGPLTDRSPGPARRAWWRTQNTSNVEYVKIEQSYSTKFPRT